MKFKGNVDMAAFMDMIRRCKGDVYFTSTEGDYMNMKSTLTQYMFSGMSNQEDFIQKGDIVCSRPEDEELLSEFLRSGDESGERDEPPASGEKPESGGCEESDWLEESGADDFIIEDDRR